MHRPHFHPWLALFALCAPAAAQLELPKNKVEAKTSDKSVVLPASQRGNVVERTIGKQRDAQEGSGSARGLDLPRSVPPATRVAPVARDAGPVSGVGPATVATAPLESSAADFVLTELEKVRDVQHAMVDHAAQSLLRMGDIGRSAAVRALESEHAPTLMAGVKVLLQTGVPADGELVQARLRRRLPSSAAVPLVNTLAALDPVRASPSFLAELLAHPQMAVRTAAQRQLAAHPDDVPASSLLPALGSKSSDARLRAVQLLASSADPAATRLLFERLSDASPEVARRAVVALAGRDDDGLGTEFLRRAFDGPWVLRDQSYALLALCEREDLLLQPLLQPAHIPRLLEGLDSSEPFVAGCCAAALAGIGFRSADLGAGEWLDLEVPHRLVRAVSAGEFSADFASLVPTAQRRLALISGQSFGSDGPSWIEWWTANAAEFRACRAVLDARLEAAGTLEVRVVGNAGTVDAFALVGPERAEDAAAARELKGETYYLSQLQARALIESLRETGVFDAQRLPGVRGSALDAGRSLTVRIGTSSKSFRFSGAAGEPWFEAALEAARNLRQRNLWQRYRDPAQHADALSLWRAEADWWDETTDESVRNRRLATMMLDYLAATPPSDRDGSLGDLEHLQSRAPVLTVEDFPRLIALIASEHFVGRRVQTTVELALASARAADDRTLPAPYAQELVSTLVEHFAGGAASEIALVMDAGGRPFARTCVADPRPFVRAVAAAAIARGADPDDVALLLGLLDDPMPEVEAAAVLALGENRVEAARTEVLLRARAGSVAVRPNALIAAGLLGGEDTLSALLTALGDQRDPAIAPAAAKGIALLRDPETVPILVSLVARGPDDPCYAPAREGLLALGSSAWEELLRVVRSPSNNARRQAALILSEQLVPQVASVLMTLYSDAPDDSRLAAELAVLTCVDFRSEPNPSGAWWSWWEYVVHDDAQAWLVGAVGRARIEPPPADELRDGSAPALAFLARLVNHDAPYLAERARRELARLIGSDVGPLPPRGRERDAWCRAIVEAIEAKRAR